VTIGGQAVTTGVLAALLGACAWGCGPDAAPQACTALAAVGLTVDVTDAATGQPLCEAKLTATEGGYAEELSRVACSYIGAVERPGTYVVRAEAPGFVSKEVAAVRVTMDEGRCPHVRGVRLSMALVPEG